MIHVLAVTGPTASGKTALALALAERLGGEILSMDSMQLYRGMDIGTAKATPEERAAVPHHMIDILSPTEQYSAADYAVRATEVIREIAARGRLPILCGGTGLYLEAVRTGRHGAPMAADPDFRARMHALAEEEGAQALHARLAEVDPVSAAAIHPNNVVRVVRALEIYHLTGKPKSEVDAAAATQNDELSILNLTLLFQDRELLYQRIALRVDQMMAEGLMTETERLWREGALAEGLPGAAAIGYKECLPALRGEESVEAAKERLCLATRHYAKRQLTWFCGHPHTPVYVDDEAGLRPKAALIEECEALARAFLRGDDTLGSALPPNL